MKWASAASDDGDLRQAITHAASGLRAQLGGCQPDLLVAFVSPHHAEAFDRVPALLADAVPGALLLGCSGGGVIGGGHEIEQRPGVSLTAAFLPGVTITPLRLANDALPNGAAEPGAWTRYLGVDPASAPHFVLLPDPFSFDAEGLIRGIDRAYPGRTTVGGIASGGRESGQQRAVPRRARAARRRGRRGAEREPRRRHDRRPGLPADRRPDVRHRLRAQRHPRARRPPAARRCCEELHDRLEPRDRQLARHSLFLGIVMKEDREQYRQGDFLIRNLLGIDQSSGALAIGALVDPNAVVQFHLRDADTSSQDLEALLKRHREAEGASPPGALLFSCLGRGQFLYGRADHDTDLFRRYMGDVPLGGFFCNGEIGPVHGSTFLHGYTSAFALFRSRDS